MSNFDLKIGKKYHVKGFIKPVELKSFRQSTGLATVIDDGKDVLVDITDILGPIVDGLLSWLGRWIKSLFSK